MQRTAAFACIAVFSASAMAQSNYIANVPDTLQPPVLPPFMANGSNWCAPTASTNVFSYWNANGYNGVTGGFAQDRAVAGAVGWFMDTNDQTIGKGVPPDLHAGSHHHDPRGSGFDVFNGLSGFARWDPTHTSFGVANIAYPTGVPAGKNGFDWAITYVVNNGFQDAKAEIDAGRPLLSSFTHWDIFDTFLSVNVAGQNIPVWDFNEPPNPIGGSLGSETWEQDFGLGHLVTTVGYSQNFLYNGQNVNLLIVHDTIPSVQQGGLGFTTPTDLAIVYDVHWRANFDVNPVPEPASLIAFGLGLAALAKARRRTDR